LFILTNIWMRWQIFVKYCVVGIITRLWVEESEVRIPTGAKYFSFLQKSRPALGRTQPPSQWVWGTLSLSPTVKWSGREGDQSTLSSSKIENEFSYASKFPSWLVEGKLHPWTAKEKLHAMTAYRVCRGTAPLILNPGTRWRWVVTFMLWPLCPGEISSVPTEQEAGWAPEPTGFCRRKNILYLPEFEPRTVQPVKLSL
jgi:hypothetical protein